MDTKDQKSDMHEFKVFGNGSRALILTNHPHTTTHEVSRQVGFDKACFVEYQGFKELDLQHPDALPLFEWNARDWIDLDESTYKNYDGRIETLCAKGWDILSV